MDLMILFGGATVGVIIVALGVVAIIGRRISQPAQATQDKINQLEKEIEALKAGKE